MRKLKYLSGILVIFGILSGCGVDGDPGHCYFSLDWEYYNPNYGVYYYEDNNPDVPASEDIIQQKYYDCYPGIYEYYYESEDSLFVYTYTGEYELIQNPGMPGGVFNDGQNGADSYVDLFLFVYEDAGLKKKAHSLAHTGESVSSDLEIPTTSLENISVISGQKVNHEPVKTESRSKRFQSGNWEINIEEEVRVYQKFSQ